MGDTERYAAFISYSHADEEIARWFHRRLEAYRIPKAYIGRAGPHGPVGPRIGKVFRDREEFAAGGELKAEIEAALEKADALIVLCSPQSAESQYVDAEVEYFKSKGGRHIIPVIVAGEYPACLTPALRDGVDRLSADFREGRDGRDAGTLKVISGLLGVGLDDLVQRDAVARRWRMRAAIGVISLLAVLGILASTFGTLAYQNVMRAREIHASRLLEETNFLIDEALAARERGEPTVAVERALQALPVDFENPERPFSMRALAALQGAMFDSTMMFRARPTDAPIVDMVLIESASAAYAVTMDGQLLQYDLMQFDRDPRVAGRCEGEPQGLRTLDAASVIVVSTDRATCAWTYTGQTVTSLPTLSQHGAVSLQNDRIVQFHCGRDGPATLLGDAVRVRQVMLNLMTNAVKFTDAGSVTLRTHVSQGEVAGEQWLDIEVQDTGIGMCASAQERIFQPFEQGSEARGGAGLGLSISRSLVEAMGGSIHVQSTPGVGSVFLMRIPVRAAVTSPTVAPVRRAHDPDLAILVVEDQAINCTVLEHVLAPVNPALSFASNGLLALQALEHQRFDLIILDEQMPQLGGIATLREIRRREIASGHTRTPVLMLSANDSPSQHAAALAAGADMQLAKPVDPALLLPAVLSLTSATSEQAAPPVRMARK